LGGGFGLLKAFLKWYLCMRKPCIYGKKITFFNQGQMTLQLWHFLKRKNPFYSFLIKTYEKGNLQKERVRKM
jgi:hypothetical protein